MTKHPDILLDHNDLSRILDTTRTKLLLRVQRNEFPAPHKTVPGPNQNPTLIWTLQQVSKHIFLDTTDITTILGITKSALYYRVKRAEFPAPHKHIRSRHGRPSQLWQLSQINLSISPGRQPFLQHVLDHKTPPPPPADFKANKTETVQAIRRLRLNLENTDTASPHTLLALKFTERLLEQIASRDFKTLKTAILRRYPWLLRP